MINMKKSIKSAIMAAAAFLAVSCTKSSVDPLTGRYETPEECLFTHLLSSDVQKDNGMRIFKIELGTSDSHNSGKVLSVSFVGDKYFLHPAAFTPAEESGKKKGNYIIGGENGATVTINNAVKPVASGVITISSLQENYSLSGVVVTEDGRPYRLKWDGLLSYEPDPEALRLTQVLSATSNVANGTNTVTVQIGTDGISSSFDPATFQTVWTGSGYYLAADFYSEDGLLHEGTYSPSDTPAPGCYVKGYDTVVDWGFGPMEMHDWGTCWWTVEDGVLSAQKILSGDIVVKRSGSTYTITVNNDVVWAEFKGDIQALAPSGGGEDNFIPLVNLISAQNNVPNGTNSISLNIATEGVSAELSGWSYIYSGTGNYLAIDLFSGDGTLAEGTYMPASDEALAEYTWVTGYEVDWGFGPMYWGTNWWSVNDGETSHQALSEGTVTVGKDGDNYIIEGKFGGLAVRYNGPITL